MSYNINSFVGSNTLRPAVNGIFYDGEEKTAVATDSYILIASKNDYEEEKAGGIYDKKGNRMYENGVSTYKSGKQECVVRYPKWTLIMPDPKKVRREWIEVPREVIESKMKAAKEWISENKKERVARIVFQCGSVSAVFWYDRLKKFLSGHVSGRFFIFSGHRNAYYEDGDVRVLVVPLMVFDCFPGQIFDYYDSSCRKYSTKTGKTF